MTELTEREVKLMELSKLYARDFADCGAPGHSAFILIAKLAEGVPAMFQQPSPIVGQRIDYLDSSGGHIRGL